MSNNIPNNIPNDISNNISNIVSHNNSNKAVILLSAGLDSFVSLAIAIEDKFQIPLAITVDYGQQAAAKEIIYAKNICQYYNIEHIVIDIRNIMTGIKSGLLSGDIPNIEKVQLDDQTIAEDSKARVWVPNRNGFLINLASMYAENYNCNWVITGFNLEEAKTFSDNSKEFVEATNNSLYYSTSNHVKVISFTQDMKKDEIVNTALKIHVPFELIWSCYHGNDLMCGECESCQRLQRAIGPHKELVEKIKFAK